MGAGLGFKDFTTGEVLTANDVDGYLMQGVWVFASAAARSAAVTSPQEGNMSFLKDTNSTEYYDGAAWVAVAPTASGGMTLLSTTTLSGNSTIAITGISSAYKDLQIQIFGIKVASSGAYPQIKFNNASNSNYVHFIGSGTSTFTQTGASTNFPMNYSDYNTTTGNNAYSITVTNYASTTNYKPVLAAGTWETVANVQQRAMTMGGLSTNSAISSVYVLTDATPTINFTGGTVLIYGVK